MALSLVGVALLAVATACSGNRDEDVIRFDPGRADLLAHAALIGEDELPKAGWAVVAVDDFDDAADDSEGLSEGCGDLLSEGDRIRAGLRDREVGRAQKELEREGPELSLPVSVEVTVRIYEDEAGLSEAVEAYRSVLAEADFTSCFGEAFRAGLPDPDATVTPRPIDPVAAVPRGGVATAGEVEYALQRLSLSGTLRFEYYTWQYANATVELALVGPREAFTVQLVTTALTAQDDRAVRAAGPNPPAVAPVATATAPPLPLATLPPADDGPLAGLESYRYELAIEGDGLFLESVDALLAPRPGEPTALVMTGAYVAPDAAQLLLELNGETIGLTTIGGQQWTSLGGLTVGPSLVPPQSHRDLSLVAAVFDSGFGDLIGLFGCTDEVAVINGLEARRCGLPAAEFEELAPLFDGLIDTSSGISTLAAFSFEAWLSTGAVGEYPVRVRLEMSGVDQAGTDFAVSLAIDLSELNAPIEIAPPATP